MTKLLLPVAALLSMMFGANLAYAGEDPVICPPNPQGSTCPIGTYPVRTGLCTFGYGTICIPVPNPPLPKSLTCTTYAGGGALCEAWPQSVENGLITYSWSVKGRLTLGGPASSTSPNLYVNCAPGQSGTVTAIMTGPGYASSTVTTSVVCGDL